MANREIRFHSGSFTISVSGTDFNALSKTPEAEWVGTVRSSASSLRNMMAAAAPYRTGALRAGLIVAPGREKSKTFGKIVNDIVFDAAMNDVFVKMSKSGKRYYYPASQEYGFRSRHRRRVPGKYFMRDSIAAYSASHEEAVIARTVEILEAL